MKYTIQNQYAIKVAIYIVKQLIQTVDNATNPKGVSFYLPIDRP
jgi:hypothetical protein